MITYNKGGAHNQVSTPARCILALLAASFDALFPLAVAIGLTVDSPLIFSAGMVIGFGLASVVYLASSSAVSP